jgi:hypothetical protein
MVKSFGPKIIDRAFLRRCRGYPGRNMPRGIANRPATSAKADAASFRPEWLGWG